MNNQQLYIFGCMQAVIARIKSLGALSVTKVRKMDVVQETVKFPLPKGLKKTTTCAAR